MSEYLHDTGPRSLFLPQTNVITAWSLERHFCYPVAIKTKLNTRVSIQANKIDLAASYVARLQHWVAICAIVSITVTTATIPFLVKT